MYLVYKHTSPSGKSYIGLTSDYDQRCANHKKSTSACRRFAAAIKKYGWDNFLHEELANGLSLYEANAAESRLINEYGTLAPYGYNLTTGGDAKRVSDDTKAAMSKAHTGKQQSITTRLKKSTIMKSHPSVIARADGMSRNYTVTNPSGASFEIRNLNRFCKENGLDQAAMAKVAKGVYRQHKGWTVSYLTQ